MRLLFALMSVLSFAEPAAASAPAPFAPKVVVFAMIAPEAEPWITHEKPSLTIEIDGLSEPMRCTPEGLCVVTTGMGYANAASSVSAVALSPRLDLGWTWFVVAGIAGVSPECGTLGSAHWARYVIDVGLRHQVDPRQAPPAAPDGVLALGTGASGEAPVWTTGTEIYRLNEALLQKAYRLSRDVPLADTPQAQAARRLWPQAAAQRAPFVGIGDTLSADTFWFGSRMATQMHDFAVLQSGGKAEPCTTQMEDNATLTALTRAANAGRLDIGRVAVLRTASNFEREKPDAAIGVFTSDMTGFGIAAENAWRAGSALTRDILTRWDLWREGVPEDQD